MSSSINGFYGFSGALFLLRVFEWCPGWEPNRISLIPLGVRPCERAKSFIFRFESLLAYAEKIPRGSACNGTAPGYRQFPEAPFFIPLSGWQPYVVNNVIRRGAVFCYVWL